MAIDKKIPRYLNQDSDYVLTEISDMTDALNIRVSTDESGNAGVIKNIKGNESISLSESLPLGYNKVVGTYQYEAENELYFFVFNFNDEHTIWRYSPSVSSDAELVLKTDALEFKPYTQLQVSGMVVGSSVYLYFTDGITEPKRVNVNAALNGNYVTGSTYAERVSQLTVIRKYPKEILGYFNTDNSRPVNKLFGSSFQFAAQYVYTDGEVSALGKYSTLYAANNTLNNVIRTESSRLLYNRITLSLDIEEPQDSIESVRFFVRNDAAGTFYYIGDVDNFDFQNGQAIFNFYNDANYPAVADSEFNKLEDSVPRKAQAQTISGNRLIYGNYVEGFDKVNATANIDVEYLRSVFLEDLDIHILPTDELNNVVIYWDLTSVPDSPDSDYNVLESDSVVQRSSYTHDVGKFVSLTTPVGSFFDTNATIDFNIAQYNEIFSYVIDPHTDRADAASKIIAAHPDELTLNVGTPLSGGNPTRMTDSSQGFTWDVYYGGTITFEAVSQTYYASSPDSTFSGKPIIKFVWRIKEWNLSATHAELISSSNPSLPVGAVYDDVTSLVYFQNGANENLTISGLGYLQEDLRFNKPAQKTFKTHDTHGFGVVYYDKYGRSSGVQKIGSADVLGLHDPARLGKKGNCKVKVTMTSSMPSWAEYFGFVYDGGKKYNYYNQYSVIEAMVADSTDLTASESNIIYIALRGLQGKDQSYTVEDDAKIEYNYSEGDRLRVLRYRTGTNDYEYPLDLEFEIVGFAIYDDPVTSPLVPTGNSNTDEENFRKTGYFLKVRAVDYTNFTRTAVSTGTDYFSNQLIVEIYSPKNQNVGDSVYYEINGLHTRANHSQTITLTDGNSWFTKRGVKQLPWDSVANKGDRTTKTLVTINEFVESAEYSDFSEIKAYTKGKPRGVIENEKQINRYASITYSEPYIQDSSRLWLSSFNNSLANWYDYDVNNGGIYGLVDLGQSITMLQEDKVSIIPTNANIIETKTGNNLVALSTEFIGPAKYYDGQFGIGKDRGAFVLAEGDIYIFDVQRGSVYKLGTQGLEQISSRGMSAYFENLGNELSDFVTQDTGGIGFPSGRNLYLINMGHDRSNSEIIISVIKGQEDAYTLPESNYFSIDWNYSKKAISFDYSMNQWSSFHDINCDGFANISNKFYHFKTVSGNIIWESEKSNTYSNFFGTQKTAYFETVFNGGKFNRKVYHALSIDGDAPADVTMSTKTQTASISRAALVLKEDEYFSSVPRVGGNNEYVALGIVVSKNGNQITFGSRINRMPFRLGGAIFGYNGTQYTNKSCTIDSVISATTILVSSGANINIGDSLVVKGDSNIDGDPLRGSWAKTKFEFNETTGIEILAVNVSVSDSKLHNPSGTEQ